LNLLSVVYGQATRFRRRWYEQHPHLQRQLGCPVISVGNLVMGGSGKTPVVAALAVLLRDAGYVPAILSRGYKRRSGADIVVVSDRQAVLADVDASGDEPQMLARRLPGVPVVVSADRHRAGSVARQRLGANVLLLDDGFQHLQVARTVNLLLLSKADMAQHVVPGGRLREPLDAARRADALLVADGDGNPMSLARAVGVSDAFSIATTYQPLRLVSPYRAAVLSPPTRVVTVTGIARPERFGAALRTAGFDVLQEIAYPDHHWYTSADVQRVQQTARATGAEAILTTEKDAVRLGSAAGPVPIMFLPIDAHVEPADMFRTWLLDRIGPLGART
jgi:tetraacyldisaccharide 4'-kinase